MERGEDRSENEVKAETRRIPERLGNRGGGGFSFILFLLVLCGIGYFAASYHVVHTPGGLRLYPKAIMGFHDTFVDLQRMSLAQLAFHLELARAVSPAGDLAYLPGSRAHHCSLAGGRKRCPDGCQGGP